MPRARHPKPYPAAAHRLRQKTGQCYSDATCATHWFRHVRIPVDHQFRDVPLRSLRRAPDVLGVGQQVQQRLLEADAGLPSNELAQQG